MCESAEKISICNNLNGTGKKYGIMVVVDSPFKEENSLMISGVGYEFRRLERWILNKVGLDSEDVFFTHAVRCFQKDVLKPSLTTLRNCRIHLENEIKKVNPKVIVCMGGVGLNSLLKLHKDKKDISEKKNVGMGGVEKWQGYKIWSKEFDCWIIPTYSLTHIIAYKDKDYYKELDDSDFKRRLTEFRCNRAVKAFKDAIDLVKKEKPHRKKENLQWTNDFLNSVDWLIEILKKNQLTPIAVDTETTSLNWMIAKLLGVSFCCEENTGFYISVRNFTRRQKKIIGALIEEILNKFTYVVFHHGSYDRKILEKNFKIQIPLYYDTMILAQLLNENFFKSLKNLSWIHTLLGGYDDYIQEYKRKNNIKNYGEIPDEILGPYGAYDAVVTWILFKKFFNEIKSIKTYSLYKNIIQPIERVFSDCEKYGMVVDVDQAQKLKDIFEKMVIDIDTKVYEIAGQEFNISSSKQLQEILFDKLKIKPIKKTKSGFSTDVKTLKQIAKQKNGAIAKLLVDRSYINSQLKSFINPILKNNVNGRMHTNYNLCGAKTGRPSCSNPNIHNIPNDAIIRNLFLPSDGCKLVVGDIAGAELGVIASDANEKTLLYAFENSLDLHEQTYNVMFDKPKDYTPTKEERAIGKIINFGIVYGMREKSLSILLNKTIEETKKLMALYFVKMPNIKPMMEKFILSAKEVGYTETFLGRRRHLPDINVDDWGLRTLAERQAGNSPIQGTASDIAYIAILRIKEKIVELNLNAKIIHSVYDSIIVDTPENEIDIVYEIMKHVFDEPIEGMKTKMRLDVDIQNKWGEDKKSKTEEIYFYLYNEKIA